MILRIALLPALLGYVSAVMKTVPSAQKGGGVFSPFRLPFRSLIDDEAFTVAKEGFKNALTEVGMITITNMSDLEKESVLKSLHPCISKSQATQEQELEDGTRRRTIATHSVPGPGGMQSISHSPVGDENVVSCDEFSKASDKFRQAVSLATEAFAKRVSTVLSTGSFESDSKPLLVTKTGHAFQTFDDVVESGHHLEHFHSYQGSFSSDTVGKSSNDDTIEWHTDQGLFIVFTPATLVREESSGGSSIQGISDGFYIQLKDGRQVLVEFSESDDLVVLLGDGVNQYINPSVSASNSLRAAPHALSMPLHAHDEARVWYGRMVLPPSSAVHPKHDETFERLRELMLEETTSNVASVSMGCSHLANARYLQTTACEEGTINCWHRCMSAEEHGVSAEICAEAGLDLYCINPRGQLWDFTHGDFYPGCVDVASAENNTALPSLPNYPREENSCSSDEFVAFQSNGEYDNQRDLQDGAASFHWTIKEDGVVTGKLTYNGLFGYLALGFAGDGGEKNGMHGAHIIMALPGANYSAVTGLDLTIEPNVEEYVIDPDGQKASFRHWSTPVSSDDSVAIGKATTSFDLYDVEFDDCFTALTFETAGFHGKPFNLTGTDHLMWAANGVDYFAGYHTHRGHIYVNWTGDISEAVPNEGTDDGHDEDGDDNDHEEEDKEDTTSQTESSGFLLHRTFSLFGLTVAVVFCL